MVNNYRYRLDTLTGMAYVSHMSTHTSQSLPRVDAVGRKGRCVELNGGYWADGLKYLKAAELDANMPSLFDVLDDGAAS